MPRGRSGARAAAPAPAGEAGPPPTPAPGAQAGPGAGPEEAADTAGTDALRALEERLHREDPRFAEALAHGRPCRPREYRHGRAWLLTGFGLVLLGIGIAVGDGLLIATGLVTAGLGGHLFDPPHGPRAPRR